MVLQIYLNDWGQGDVLVCLTAKDENVSAAAVFDLHWHK